MGLLRRKQEDGGAAPKTASSRSEERIDRILNLPFPLSFPFFAVGMTITSISIFFFLNKVIHMLVSRNPYGAFFFITTVKKHAYEFENIVDIRWKYYIPGDLMDKGTLFFAVALCVGISMLVLYRWMLFLYEKKSFAGPSRE